jgi:hypothetical protein
MEPTRFVTANRDSKRLSGMAAGMVCLTLVFTRASAAPVAVPDLKAQVQSNYGELPGQAEVQVKHLARGRGYALFLPPSEAVLSLKKPQAQTKASPSAVKSSSSSALD